jgi:hypothetical protein
MPGPALIFPRSRVGLPSLSLTRRATRTAAVPVFRQDYLTPDWELLWNAIVDLEAVSRHDGVS